MELITKRRDYMPGCPGAPLRSVRLISLGRRSLLYAGQPSLAE